MKECCWNCKQFDSFACICHKHGVEKDTLDVCDDIEVDEYEGN